MPYTPTTWANGPGGGTPLDAANLTNMEDGIVAANLAAPVPATSLPGSPEDGQQALLVDSLTAPTYAWLFRYDAAITDANKWVFLGGAPGYAEVDTSQTRSANTYGDLATVGPSFTMPRAGLYVVRIGARIDTGGFINGGLAVIALNGTAGADTEAVALIAADADVNAALSLAVTRNVTVATAGHVLKLMYRNTNNSNNVTFADRFVEVVPFRVA